MQSLNIFYPLKDSSYLVNFHCNHEVLSEIPYMLYCYLLPTIIFYLFINYFFPLYCANIYRKKSCVSENKDISPASNATLDGKFLDK